MSIDKTEIPIEKFQFIDNNYLASEHIDAPLYSYWKSVFRKFFSSKLAIVALIIMIFVVLMSFFQPMFSGYDLTDVSGIDDFDARYNPPSAKFWFGTDGDGKSLFDAVWAGARTSISIGILGTLICEVLGVIIGAIWGNSKRVDRLMLEIYNIISNVPQLLVVIVLSYVFGAGFWNLLFAMTCTSWFKTAYLIRVQVMIMRDREYNLASHTLGTKTWRLIVKNIFPYLVSIIMTNIAIQLPEFISYEVFLSFLGVGLSADTPSLGRIINQYSLNMTNYPYLFWIPVIVLALVTVSLYLVGQRLADASDPRAHM
ncbi:MAG: ABC transporter permease [Lactobacillales bacterium]|jgi:oligopeptide transport system permease protein|nr:ABC transporter permease [Lactobacillales bacterium]